MAKGPSRVALRTILIVGEGHTELALLQHLKSIYGPRGSGTSITLRNAHGKGPEHVVDTAIRQARQAAYDVKAALLDTDIPWTPKLRSQAQAKRITLIGSAPCVEGLLLRLMGATVPHATDECKTRWQTAYPGDWTQVTTYAPLLTAERLHRRRDEIEALDTLIRVLQGQNPR